MIEQHALHDRRAHRSPPVPDSRMTKQQALDLWIAIYWFCAACSDYERTSDSHDYRWESGNEDRYKSTLAALHRAFRCSSGYKPVHNNSLRFELYVAECNDCTEDEYTSVVGRVTVLWNAVADHSREVGGLRYNSNDQSEFGREYRKRYNAMIEAFTRAFGAGPVIDDDGKMHR